MALAAVGDLLVQMLRHPFAEKSEERAPRIKVDEVLEHPAWKPLLSNCRGKRVKVGGEADNETSWPSWLGTVYTASVPLHFPAISHRHNGILQNPRLISMANNIGYLTVSVVPASSILWSTQPCSWRYHVRFWWDKVFMGWGCHRLRFSWDEVFMGWGFHGML